MDGLLGELSSAQLSEWMAYFQLEPFGERRADLRAGIIASTVANAHRGKDGRPYKPQDFMPDFGDASAGDEAAALLAKAKAAFGAAFGAVEATVDAGVGVTDL